MVRRNAIGFIIEATAPTALAAVLHFAIHRQWAEMALGISVVIVARTVDRIAQRVGIGVYDT